MGEGQLAAAPEHSSSTCRPITAPRSARVWHRSGACLPHLKTLALSRSTLSSGQALLMPSHVSATSHLWQSDGNEAKHHWKHAKQSNGWCAAVDSQQQTRLCAAVRRPTHGQEQQCTEFHRLTSLWPHGRHECLASSRQEGNGRCVRCTCGWYTPGNRGRTKQQCARSNVHTRCAYYSSQGASGSSLCTPAHFSSASQGPAGFRHWTVLGLKGLAGQIAESPVHLQSRGRSGWWQVSRNQQPSNGRHSVHAWHSVGGMQRSAALPCRPPSSLGGLVAVACCHTALDGVGLEGVGWAGGAAARAPARQGQVRVVASQPWPIPHQRTGQHACTQRVGCRQRSTAQRSAALPCRPPSSLGGLVAVACCHTALDGVGLEGSDALAVDALGNFAVTGRRAVVARVLANRALLLRATGQVCRGDEGIGCQIAPIPWHACVQAIKQAWLPVPPPGTPPQSRQHI